MVILDEAVSALDKSVEAQVLNLLRDLKQQFNLTYLFISHDLNVVRYISDRVLVMYLGRVVETRPVEDIFTPPAASLHAGAARLAPVDGSRRGASRNRRSPAIRPTRSIRPPAAASTRAALRRSGLRARHAAAGRRGRGCARCRHATLPPATSGPASGHSLAGRSQPRGHPLATAGARACLTWTSASPRRSLEVDDLTVRFVTREATVHAVNGVSFTRAPRRGAVHPGRVRLRQERHAARADAPAAAHGARVSSGAVRIDGQDVLALRPRALRELRGGLVSMIFQEPMTALDPVYTIGAADRRDGATPQGRDAAPRRVPARWNCWSW